MNGFQSLKKQLLPLFRGFPYIVGIFALALFLAFKYVQYASNEYQSVAKIKLDDQRYGFSGNNLYGDFDVFTAENKIEAEVEVLKSPLLIGKLLDSLDLDVVIEREGKIKRTLLYDDAPIKIEYSFEDEEFYDHEFFLRIDQNEVCYLSTESEELSTKGKMGDSLLVGRAKFLVTKNESVIQNKGISLAGDYVFNVKSRRALINEISSKLNVQAVDKDVAVLRVVYREGHPQKVSDVINRICELYVEDYVSTKTSAANQTLNFIDQKLSEVGEDLKRAEINLERFKTVENVVNTRQETETGLREISKLKIQLINLEVNEQAIQQLQRYIDNGDYFDETAISFGFGDLLMTELVKKMKVSLDERHELLAKYTPDHEKVKVVDRKIEEVKAYVKEGIRQNLKDIEIKRTEAQLALEEATHMFDDLPTREKNQHILEREFRLLEDVYNFLSQKKIEASIASSASLSFHRIIHPADVPIAAVSPNKTLIVFVSGFLGLILGITFVYLKQAASAKVRYRQDIERLSLVPIAGLVRRNREDADCLTLTRTLLVKSVLHKNQVIAVSSTLNNEGKSSIAFHLSKALIAMGYKVCLVKRTGLSESEEVDHGMRVITLSFEQPLPEGFFEALKDDHDFIIVDTMATGTDISGVEVMSEADLTLFIARTKHTCLNYIAQLDQMMEEYALKNVHWVLNDADKASNYSGIYLGRRFQKGAKPVGLINRWKSFLQTYLKS